LNTSNGSFHLTHLTPNYAKKSEEDFSSSDFCLKGVLLL